jgi:hypothetical protein
MNVDCSNRLDNTTLENDESVAGIISDLKSLEEIVKNLKNENNILKENFSGAFKSFNKFIRVFETDFENDVEKRTISIKYSILNTNTVLVLLTE